MIEKHTLPIVLHTNIDFWHTLISKLRATVFTYLNDEVRYKEWKNTQINF